MRSQDVIDRSTSRRGAAAAVSREDALAETMGTLMLWLIPVLAFLLAIFSIR